ncbi:MAG: XTP/dITP diphosphatase [Lachnospiraceae bacterium]|nr:XTP/dITP diphosphatase [Lachnospiraceae bacterium]
MKVVFATSNEHKLTEVREILSGSGIEVLSLKDVNVSMEDVEETGKSFKENAIIKAKYVAEKAGMAALADDSGLEVDYINKEPGIYSARYMGEDTSYTIKNNNIIERLKDAKEGERTARFVCVIAAVFPDGKILDTQGTMEGEIAHEIRGENGFGYDPILYLPELKKTSAELSPEEKNAISHRGKALRSMKEMLEKQKDNF